MQRPSTAIFALDRMHRLKLKHISTILLALSLMAPYLANFVCFQNHLINHKKLVKKRFSAGLRAEELTKFVFSPEEFTSLDWDGDDEFYLNTKKYDLHHWQEYSDSIVVWAWWDDKESQLEKRFHRFLKREKDAPLKNKSALSLDQLSKFLANQKITFSVFACADQHSTSYLAHLPKVYLKLESPPPILV